jgi:4-hydroxybenzoate polyprenyltransferase
MTLKFWKNYVRICRPHLLFVSGTAGLAGLSLFAGDTPGRMLIPAIAFFVILGASYGLYSALSFDNRPDCKAGGPFSTGEVDEVQVIGTSLILLALCSLVFVVSSFWILPFLLVILIGGVLSAFVSRYWWGSLLFKPAALALLPVIAALTMGIGIGGVFSSKALLYLVLSVFFSGAVYVLLESFKNCEVDLRDGAESLPLLAGKKMSLLLSLGFTVAAFVASSSLVKTVNLVSSPLSWYQFAVQILWGGGFLILFYVHYSMVAVQEESDIAPDSKGVIRAFILIRCGEAAAFNLALVPVMLIVGIFFELSQLCEKGQ